MYIKPKSGAKSLWEVGANGDLAMEALLYAANEDVPCPWDADIEVKGDTVIIFGNLSAGGPSNATCSCKCSVSNFDEYYKLELPDAFVSDQMSEEDLQALWDAGWERA